MADIFGTSAQFVEGAVWGLWIFAGLLIFALALFAWNYYRRFPITIHVWEKIGDAHRIEGYDAGRIVEKNGVKKIVGRSRVSLFSRLPKIDMEAIDYELMQATKSGGYLLQVLKKGYKDYVPFNVKSWDSELRNFKLEQTNQRNLLWAWNKNQQIREDYTKRSFWRDHGMTIVLGAGIAFVLVMQVLSWDYYTTNNQQVLESNERMFNKLVNPQNIVPANAAPPPPALQAQNPNQPAPPSPLPFEGALT